MISLIGTLFFVGSGSTIMSIITEIPRRVHYKRQEEKVILDVSLLSGIDINDNSDIHADFDEVD
jgi:hypothetical protein